jgi:hypothetical protein
LHKYATYFPSDRFTAQLLGFDINKAIIDPPSLMEALSRKSPLVTVELYFENEILTVLKEQYFHSSWEIYIENTDHHVTYGIFYNAYFTKLKLNLVYSFSCQKIRSNGPRLGCL